MIYFPVLWLVLLYTSWPLAIGSFGLAIGAWIINAIVINYQEHAEIERRECERRRFVEALNEIRRREERP
jgi:hypothetical protein